MENSKNKLEMYKAVENVCAAHHEDWNKQKGFGGAFSRFVTKVAALDLMNEHQDCFRANDNEFRSNLISEIDSLLQNTIDALVDLFKSSGHPFYHSYLLARTGR